MCGRYSLAKPPMRLRVGAEVLPLVIERPRYNVAPMQLAPVIRFRDGQLVTDELRWGLIPAWAKDAKFAAQCINARSETVADKPAFRSAFKSRRCLVPADGFYEWAAVAKQKLPWRFVRTDGEPFLLAGLWECWEPKEQPAVREETFTILTTVPNEVTRPVHDRMPVILDAEAALRWLAPEATGETLSALCVPCPSDTLRRFRVSTVVNSARNDLPECVAPLPEQTGFTGI